MGYLKKVIKSIVIGLGIAICFIIIKNQFSIYLLTDAEYGIPMLIKHKHIDNLFLGSSTFRQGLDIKQIEKILGNDSYILSYDGNQPIMEYYELQNLYDHGVEIERLFVDFYPYTAASGFKISDTKIFLETDIHFKIQIAVKLLEDGRFEDVCEMFIGANNELLLTWPFAYPLINTRFYKGGSTVETPALKKQELDNLAVPYGESLNAIQMEYLLKIISLAKEKETEVIFIEVPKYNTLLYNKQYVALADEMENKIGDVKIYRINLENKRMCRDGDIYFPLDQAEFFNDLVHLSSLGRVEFTKKLLDKIKYS